MNTLKPKKKTKQNNKKNRTFINREGAKYEDKEREDNEKQHCDLPPAEEPAQEQRPELFLLSGQEQLRRLPSEDRSCLRDGEAIALLLRLVLLLMLILLLVMLLK